MTTSGAQPYLPVEVARIYVDESNRGFWEAARQHRLTIQRCSQCRVFQHPPRAASAACHSLDLECADVSGRGSVDTYTIVHHPIGELADHVPFNVIVVELDEAKVRFVSNLIDTAPQDVAIGQRVELAWEDVSEEFSVPRFRLVAS